MSTKPAYYTAKDIRAAMSITQCVDAMAYGFSALYNAKALVPDRVINNFPDQGATQLVMPAVLPELDLLITKLVTVNPGNRAKELPLIHALITAQRASTGEVLATLDGVEITSMRTAAASALATRLFAEKNATVLGIVGTGVQARYHIESIRAVLPIDKILVRGSSEPKAAAFCEKVKADVGIDCQPAKDFKAAQIICTCTTTSAPVLSLADISPGTHINAVGSFRLTDRELAADIITSSKVIIDEWGGCIAEAGDVMIPIQEGAITREHVTGELGYWVEHIDQFDRTAEDITVFKSVGNAVQDAAAVASILGLL